MGPKLELHWSLARRKRFPETIVFVHNMFGSHKSVKRHQRWLNSLGYNTVSFDLILGSPFLSSFLSWGALTGIFGFFETWQRQITKVCDRVDGPKIVYSFSGPSLSAIAAVSLREDVRKVICDGGPFLNIYENTYNLFSHDLGIPAEKLLKPIAVGFAKVGQKGAEKLLKTALGQWPETVPILSIRGLKDPIVPEKTIANAFQGFAGPLQVFSLPEGTHIDGLKKFTELYKERVQNFMETPP